jgi:4-diphosphocytidyl-2-C-methyl-D-erythritol kinase
MEPERHADTVIVRAPAKVNLFLEILGKRADGYHEITTLMIAVNLCDRLVLKEDPSGDIELRCNRRDLSTGPDNLVTRAALLLKEHTASGRGAKIRLTKRIPMQAGLAGGSTDAAAALQGLNELWQTGLTREELEVLGARVGSDVPFFLDGPAAWCTGRGEQVAPLRLGRPLYLVLVCPPVGLATADVYCNVSVPAEPQTGDEIRQAVESGDVEAIGRHLHNRLQAAAEQLCPAIAQYQARLAQLGPAGQLMSGSGSSLFALCRGRDEARRLANQLRHGADGEQVFLVRSC